MPKKFGTNTKKEEAREREAQKKKDKRDEEVRQAEDVYWRETDDKINKKLQKDKEKERQRLEAIKRKQENKEAVDKEMQELQMTSYNKLILESRDHVKAPTKREIEEYKEKALKKLIQQRDEEQKEEGEEIDVEKEFVNPNYSQTDLLNERGVEVIDVTGVEDALTELTLTEIDKHPEKRMRAAWNVYFEKQLPLFKTKYPSAKRSQLIDLIQKEFKKSPDNPVYRQQLLMIKEAEK